MGIFCTQKNINVFLIELKRKGVQEFQKAAGTQTKTIKIFNFTTWIRKLE